MLKLLSNPYALAGMAIALVGLVATSFGLGWKYGGREAEADLTNLKLKQAEATVVAQAAEIERGEKGNAELLRRIELLPPITTTTREVVHANPSSCAVPAPVARSLRESVKSANQALSAK